MKNLVLATKNKGKITELSKLLEPLNIHVISANDVALPDVDETGSTFEENAILKAEAIAEFTGKPALADDSGLCVDALNGGPGVKTARFGDYHNLLQTLSGLEPKDRAAHFACVLAFAIPGQKTLTFEGVSEGLITLEPQGEQGFGFDPIFVPKGDSKTYAQMTSQEKSKTSHRSKALNLFVNSVGKHLATS